MAQEACPPGWHLPSKAEWEYLISGQGGYELCIAKLRKTDTWKAWYTNAASSSASGTYLWGENDGDTHPVPSGFDAVPSGMSTSTGSVMGFGMYTFYWSSDGTAHNVFYQYRDTLEGNYQNNPETYYYSVRCVKD